METIPALDMGSCFLMIFQCAFPGMFHCPFPRSMSRQHSLRLLVAVRNLHCIKSHRRKCTRYFLHIARLAFHSNFLEFSFTVCHLNSRSRSQYLKYCSFFRLINRLRHTNHRHSGHLMNRFFKFARGIDINKSNRPRFTLSLFQNPQILRTVLRQRQCIHQIEIQRFDTVPHKPMRSRILISQIIIHTPRCNRLW